MITDEETMKEQERIKLNTLIDRSEETAECKQRFNKIYALYSAESIAITCYELKCAWKLVSKLINEL